MNNEKREFLNLKNIPARLEMQEAGWYLGFAPHAIPILIRAGLLKPLGRPAANGVKYFATATLAELREDTQWLARASDALTRYWQNKNARKAQSCHEPSFQDGFAIGGAGGPAATRSRDRNRRSCQRVSSGC